MSPTPGTVTRNDVDLNDAMRNGEALRPDDAGRAPAKPGAVDPGWTWPPSAPMESVGGAPFGTDDWAPASTVRRPWVRVGRWTLLYRRAS
jgi:hypothetical protein